MESNIQQPKSVGFDFIQSSDLLKRKGFSFYWGGSLFDGKDFGTRIGPTDSVFDGLLHDFAHCVDFAITKKIRQVSPTGLIFRTPWKKWNDYLSCEDGYPETSQHIHTEARAFAIQGWLMMQVAGSAFVTEGEYVDSTYIYTAKKVGIDEWIAEQGELIKWMDAYIFNDEQQISSLPYKERNDQQKIAFSSLIRNYYSKLNGKEITQAITRVAEKVRYNKSVSRESEPYYRNQPELIIAF